MNRSDIAELFSDPESDTDGLSRRSRHRDRDGAMVMTIVRQILAVTGATGSALLASHVLLSLAIVALTVVAMIALYERSAR